MEEVPQAEHIRFLFDPRDALPAFAGQRRRLASTAADLSAEELATASRCAGWTVADVLRHLVWVDRTMDGLWSGKEAIAAGFDPRTTPDEAVHRDRAVPDEEIRDRYVESAGAMAADLDSSGPDRFGRPSLSPAGQVPWWMSAVHIGWDSCIHERDVLAPLGRRVDLVDGETELCLAYSLVLASFFAGRDALAVRIGDVEVSRGTGPVVVQRTEDSAPARSAGSPTRLAADDRVALVDAMAGRGPVEGTLRGDPAVVRRLGGLARYFTAPVG